MQQKNEIETENKILDAAKKVFLSKGYFGTRMQEIADEAGINKAMLHYYFRSKDKMFEKILRDALSTIVNTIVGEFLPDATIEENIRAFIRNYITMMKANPYIPAFILHEMNHNVAMIKNIFGNQMVRIPDTFIIQIKKAIAEGKIKPIEPEQLIISIVGLCVFPFIGKPLFMMVFRKDENEYDSFMDRRIDIIPDIILNGILTTSRSGE